VAAGCGTSSDKDISLIAYSTPKDAYAEIIPAFQKTSEGKGTNFTQSYGASGDQSRAVQNGLKADVVALSLEPDVTKLVKKGLVADNWNQDKYHGFVTNSVVVFAVRPGNPKHIKTWDDLVKPGVQVIEPNPFSSGGAKWNIMAAYGAQLKQGKSPQQAEDYLLKLFKNVPVQDKSARDALQTFSGGKGDVLLAYENEAIGAGQKGQKVEYVLPDQTILIQNPIAVIKNSSAKTRAQDFVNYATTTPAQKVFVSKGYRSVIPSLNPAKEFPKPPALFDISYVGGWTAVDKKFFTPNGVVGKIEQKLGVSTEKG
jgi:sulfate transport system substrate-binding protein